MNINTISQVVVLPAYELVVTVRDVHQLDGIFVATVPNCAVTIGWRRGTNDWPVDGQRWLIRILGLDAETDILIAEALMREE